MLAIATYCVGSQILEASEYQKHLQLGEVAIDFHRQSVSCIQGQLASGSNVFFP